MQLKSFSLLFFLFIFFNYNVKALQGLPNNDASITIDSLNILVDSANTIHSKGINEYLDDHLEKSVKLYTQSLDLKYEILKQKDLLEKYPELKVNILEGVIKSTHNIAASNFWAGNYSQAFKDISNCLTLQNDIYDDWGYKNEARLGKANHLLADIIVRSGEMGEARNKYNVAINYYDMTGNHGKMAIIYTNLSNLYDIWRIPDSSIIYAKRAIEIYQELNIQQELDDCYLNLGIAFMLKKNYAEAIDLFDRAISLYLVDSLSNIKNIARATHNKGICFGNLKKIQKGHTAFNTAITLNKKNEFQELLAGNYSGKADLFHAQQQFQQAQTHYQQSIQLHILAPQNKSPENAIKGFLEKDAIFLVTDKPGLLEALVGKAKSLAGLQQYDQAQGVFDTTLQLLHKFRRDFRDNASKIQMASIAKDLFESAIELCVHPEVQDYELAFEYAEMSRAFTLLEDVKHNQALKSLKGQENILQNEYDLRLVKNNLERQYQNTSDPSTRNNILKALQSNKSSLDSLQRILEANPDYQAIMSEWSLLSTRQIKRKLLNRGQAMVEYFVGSENTYIFVLPKRGKLKVEQLSIGRDSLAQLVDAFWDGLYYSVKDIELTEALAAKFPHSPKEALFDQYMEAAQHLYNLIFAPVKRLTNVQKFVIIPDEALNNLAFDALLEEKPEFDNPSLFPYLGRKHTISYTYSVNLLEAMQGHVDSKAILAFAPSFTGEVLKTKAPLGRLLNNKREVTDICKSDPANCSKLIGEHATKDTFINLVNGVPYKIIHLSTHGQADDRNPDNSYISFAQLQQQMDTSQLLYASELYTLLLDVEMVVLSACETNKGLIRRGEGIMSFTRALSAAGAKSVLSTLWSVDDRATRELMVAFYNNLNEDIPKDEALSLAKKSLISNGDFSQPYYWAAFIPIGNMQPEMVSYNYTIIWAIGIILLIILSFIVFKKVFTNNTQGRVLAS